jgi:hypothetical protein
LHRRTLAANNGNVWGSVRALLHLYDRERSSPLTQLARDPEFQLASGRYGAGILPGSTSGVGRLLPDRRGPPLTLFLPVANDWFAVARIGIGTDPVRG